ncbi:UDP-N-acetylmuramoyl-tripeptide--D-alanyl-D-alanine ligase [Candidatus Schneideria nysicola]|uniref:UDP-N-acetylmuramoyl-tripeptide--D-alanyl-D- alanine ligase n=1 Tax=Candidatus Schneideria nysicola TaxID=1081631 RepID=UPI001CAA73C7|nr:UDP-N-acetylmuramoyl-tripeptide--D-alanyl-D-alanine ligase [Candidatus Schneideria nysicola]UAJ65655.1 UDP-N-acetylmuramoyl-tripeptide--D-alanyl-D-alanine ligase [Candidatus Schneideria nysicola]
MIPISLLHIASILNAKLIGVDCMIQSISIDSRIAEKDCLFIAIKGKKFDGHEFAMKKNTMHANIIALLVNQILPIKIPQIIVTDTKHALGKLGAWIRKQVSIPTLAITGSSGKTSVKEMTVSILRECGKVVATIENFNNDIGVPLTLLNFTHQDNFAVIELGASRPGEIAYTANLVQPDTALINNLFPAHLSGFGSIKKIAESKGELFYSLSCQGRGIVNAESNDWFNWEKILKNKDVWRFALQHRSNVDFFATDIKSTINSEEFTLNSPHGSCRVYIPFPGEHHIRNALAASAAALSVGADLSKISVGLSKFKTLRGRLYPIFLNKRQLLLDDSYNANIGSTIVSAQVLAKMPGYRVMVIGDIAELGHKVIEYHIKIGQIISNISAINKVLSIGKFSEFISQYSRYGEHFKDHLSLVSRLIQLLTEYKIMTVLVKGSRSAKMDQIVRMLRERR